MQHIGEVNIRLEKHNDGPRSERDELIQKFIDRLNYSRINDGFQPIEARRVAIKLSHVPTADLHAFYKQCEQARSFGGYFWWALKPTKS